MSTSPAKKRRLKQAREGKQTPELRRLSWNGINPVAKTTPTLNERSARMNNKHKGKWNPNRMQGDDFIFHLAS
jgi:ubiquitin